MDDNPVSPGEAMADQMMNEYREGQLRTRLRSTSRAETWSYTIAAVLLFTVLAWLLTSRGSQDAHLTDPCFGHCHPSTAVIRWTGKRVRVPSDKEGTDVKTITKADSFISPEDRALLIEDVRKGWPDLTEDMGERGVNQMVAFLVTSSRTTEILTPSLRIDEFWHRFILRTVPYAVFCERLGNGFIHHVPEEAGRMDLDTSRALMESTKAAIVVAGFEIDAEFWPGEGAADCNQCHAGCSDSPVGK
ncbi:hypothetical protein [Kitasatospora sp. NPDC002040]|uniref:hypothetical protein n=1 Tax=Kitasatospora sp. NPDC002040 TaxID=3154661 RepID=UPI0033230EC4